MTDSGNTIEFTSSAAQTDTTHSYVDMRWPYGTWQNPSSYAYQPNYSFSYIPALTKEDIREIVRDELLSVLNRAFPGLLPGEAPERPLSHEVKEDVEVEGETAHDLLSD